MSETDDARTKRIGEILEALKVRKLPVEIRAKLERELESLGRVLDVQVPHSFEMQSRWEWWANRLKQAPLVPVQSADDVRGRRPMSEAPKERWPWLTGRRMLAVLVLPWIVVLPLAWDFDTVLWHDLTTWFRTRGLFRFF